MAKRKKGMSPIVLILIILLAGGLLFVAFNNFQQSWWEFDQPHVEIKVPFTIGGSQGGCDTNIENGDLQCSTMTPSIIEIPDYDESKLLGAGIHFRYTVTSPYGDSNAQYLWDTDCRLDGCVEEQCSGRHTCISHDRFARAGAGTHFFQLDNQRTVDTDRLLDISPGTHEFAISHPGEHWGYVNPDNTESYVSLYIAVECTSDDHCTAGYHCSENVCVGGEIPDPDCITDDDCGSNQVCVSGECIEEEIVEEIEFDEIPDEPIDENLQSPKPFPWIWVLMGGVVLIILFMLLVDGRGKK